ncbi:MAG: winged helix DNA-binding domain-containing protein [Deltaproteobacteria bacterium]|nr:winged helix DNA-binding domain-containing protein [Deltaproteobacteria bacterium]
MATHRVDLSTARAFWHSKQGLGRAPAGSLAEVVAKTGWLRTLGGADVYLAAKARVPAMRRADLDAATTAMDLRVLPAVRGCIYLVPRAHAPLAMRFAEGIWRKNASRDLAKVGVPWREIEAVAKAAEDTLAAGPLSTDALRRAMPTGSVRSFGEAGKKVGISSPLPLALRSLEFAGAVERTLEGGKLDSERYLWRRAARSPFDGVSVPQDAAGLARALTEIFVAQMGPVTAKHVAEWAGIGLTEAREAARELGLLEVEVTGYADDALVSPDEIDALARARPAESAVSFLSFEDNYFVPHGGPGLYVDPAHHDLEVHEWGSVRRATLGTSRHLASRSIVLGTTIGGFWELDPDRGHLELGFLESPSPAIRDRVEVVATSIAQFLTDEIGHGHAFSLDTDDSLRERLRVVRKLQMANPPTAKSQSPKPAPAKPAKSPAKKPPRSPAPKPPQSAAGGSRSGTASHPASPPSKPSKARPAPADRPKTTLGDRSPAPKARTR